METKRHQLVTCRRRGLLHDNGRFRHHCARTSDDGHVGRHTSVKLLRIIQSQLHVDGQSAGEEGGPAAARKAETGRTVSTALQLLCNPNGVGRPAGNLNIQTNVASTNLDGVHIECT